MTDDFFNEETETDTVNRIDQLKRAKRGKVYFKHGGTPHGKYNLYDTFNIS